jgi:GTPase SAR1 family protein
MVSNSYAKTEKELPPVSSKSIPDKKRIQRMNSGLSTGISTKRKTIKTASLLEDNNWDDFDFQNSDSSPLLKEGPFSSKANNMDIEEMASPLLRKQLITKKIMVIGSKGAGKHSTINSAFRSQDEEELVPLQQTMDFISKTEEQGTLQTKYHFWIRELCDHKFDSVIQVYYRTISMFIFMYSITDRSSYEALEEAMEAVRKEVPQEKFVGILIANKGDGIKQREVSHAEGISLKEKFNIASFLDLSNDEMSLRQNLHEVLN